MPLGGRTRRNDRGRTKRNRGRSNKRRIKPESRRGIFRQGQSRKLPIPSQQASVEINSLAIRASLFRLHGEKKQKKQSSSKTRENNKGRKTRLMNEEAGQQQQSFRFGNQKNPFQSTTVSTNYGLRKGV